jgi:AAA family ATP:ADP antiporter
MGQAILKIILRPFGSFSAREGATALMMFSYSFLAMTTYTIVKPITRSKFISDLGADNLPYVQLTAGILIGLVMAGYSWLISRLPRKWALQITQAGIAALLLAFWVLFKTKAEWVSVAFYFIGLILGILLISQFWTLANVVYDPRQAKRLFGFIGGGASLGGVAGSLVTSLAKQVGTDNLVLVSATLMVVCLTVVSLVIHREQPQEVDLQDEEKGVGARQALEMLRDSKHLQLIACVISFAAIGAAIIEQQLNMAAEAAKGAQDTDALTEFLGRVQLYTSIIGFAVQIAFTSRIHRLLGIGFALMILPVSLGATAVIMLLNAALWAPSVARILDTSLRYTVDKTTREILYMPLPYKIKFDAKPFVDVTVDRFAKGLGALTLVVLIKPWGLNLGWQQLSYASISITALWLFMAVKAKRGYQAAFRSSLETRQIKPAEMKLAEADLSTVETLIQELASVEEQRVLYAIDLLESLDKRNLVTPLLLYHESPAVRVRALSVVSRADSGVSKRWLPVIEKMMGDENPDVRMAAISALAEIRSEKSLELIRPFLQDRDPRIAMTAALVLAQSRQGDDATFAEEKLRALATDVRESSTATRLELATAISRLPGPGVRRLLIPLLHDPEPAVAEQAMRSARQVSSGDFFFVPTMVSLLRHRRLKSSAREVLIGYGEDAVPVLRHFLHDPQEDPWVRRHIPATLARIPAQASMNALVEALSERDSFIRYKVLAGIERLHRIRPDLAFAREPLESLALDEASRHGHYLPLVRKLFERDRLPDSALLCRAVCEKLGRSLDRIYRILSVLYPWKDIAAARWEIEQADGRSRAGALEYLDNLLSGSLRKHIVPALEQRLPGPGSETGTGILTPERREALRTLIADSDEVITSTAIHVVGKAKLTALVPDVEEILAARDVRHWFAFETASWVLAAFRLSDERRWQLWREPIPAVELAGRLHSLPLFASVSVDELFRIAHAGQQGRYQPGRLLYEATQAPQDVKFLLDGRVAMGAPAGAIRIAEPPLALGLQELLEDRPMSQTVRTLDASACLSLSGEDFRTMLADNTDLMQGLFRTLSDGDTAGGQTLLRGSSAGARLSGLKELNPAEAVFALEAIPVFSGIPAEELPWLAAAADQLRMTNGSNLFRRGEPAAIYVLVSGSLLIQQDGDQPGQTAKPGDALGIMESLAGRSLECVATAQEESLVLRLNREELLDVLSQRQAILQQFFTNLFRMGREKHTASHRAVEYS